MNFPNNSCYFGHLSTKQWFDYHLLYSLLYIHTLHRLHVLPVQPTHYQHAVLRQQFVLPDFQSVKEHYCYMIRNACNEDSTDTNRELFAHFLDCEAHTDVWRELFKTYNQTNEK